VIYQLQVLVAPPAVPVAVAVAVRIVCCYLLYLRISGQFHIIAGMLCLFGYDLPETNRRYLLASSISDFWRRANIYWKDFMIKVIYFPAYFAMRRSGELRGQLLATTLVFFVSWLLHAYQFFWLQGDFRITFNDSLFWAILGGLVVMNVWIDAKRPKRRLGPGGPSRARHALQVVATFTLIAVLWSMWSANSMTEWIHFLKTGRT
jgi:D-alanyl-lipoteichoic acid acyltransferase DltB (MBOAT superfamily)